MRHKIPIYMVVYLLALAVLLGGRFAAPWAQAQTLTTLHAFTGNPDGAGPFQANLLELNGTLYGTTSLGGAYHLGTLFRRNSQGKETVLYSFTGGADGAYPNAGLVRDKNGNLYGTTQNSGVLSCLDFGKMFPGCGTVFRLDTKGSLTVLHAFTGGTDGAGPQGLIIDSAGFLYGTTFYGGDLSCPSGIGCGIVYKMDTSGNETELYNFTGGTDGWIPNTFLTRDGEGNLYGVTVAGGNLADCFGTGCGVVFKLDTSGHETPLYIFTGGADGAIPNGALLRDSAGNLYGTTFAGGDVSCSNAKSVGCGVVFRVSPAGQEKVLHTFTGPDGANPTLGLVADASGNGYGTTQYGGTSNMGTVFAITSEGVEKVLYSFTGGTDGGFPESGLIVDKGSLYGNTYQGGDLSCNPPNGCGTLFKFGHYSMLDAVTAAQNTVPGYVPSATPGPLHSPQRNRFHIPATERGVAAMAAPMSPVSDFTKPPPALWVSVTPFTPSPVNPGGSSTSSVTAGYGTNGVGTAALTCSVQPSPPLAPTCSISPASLPFPGAPATLTVSTFGRSARLLSHPGSGLLYALWLPLIGLVATGVGQGLNRSGQKRKRKAAALACALFAGLTFQIACGSGGSGSSGTPPGTYTINVTATAFIPVNSATTSTTLTVQ